MRNSIRSCRTIIQHSSITKAFIDAKREDGITAVYLAAARGSAGVLDILLSYKASFRIPQNDGQVALYGAAQHNQLVTLRQLIKSITPKPKAMAKTKLTLGGLAKKNQNQSKGKGKWGAKPTGGGVGGLTIQTSNLQMVQFDLSNSNSNTAGRRPVLTPNMAADFDHQRTDGATALFVTCLKNCIACATELLRVGADPNICRHDETSPFAITCSKNHYELFQPLLDAGARLETSREDGATPAYMAAGNGSLECLVLLIEKEADIHSARDMDGQTPTYVAAQNGHAACLETLLDQGVDAEAARDDGYTPLYVAARRDNHDCVMALLEVKVDADSVQEDGQTALMAACRSGNTKTVKLLLNAGANGFVQSDEGYLADDYAAERQYEGAAHAVHVHCLRQANIIRQLQSAFFHDPPHNFFSAKYRHHWEDETQYKIELGQEPTPMGEQIDGKCYAFVLKNFLMEHPDFPFNEHTVRAALANYRDEDGDRIANNRVRVHFKKPRPCEKWACLLTMEPIDRQDKGNGKSLTSRLKFW